MTNLIIEMALAGFKIGKFNHLLELADPNHQARDINDADEDCLRECVTKYFPLAGACPTSSST